MGLDIYLNTRADAEASQAYDTAWEAIWERFEKGEITEEEREKLNDELERPDRENADAITASAINPEHLFNRRYLRSSYNGGGFNRAVPDFLGDEGATLYGIFAPLIGSSQEPDSRFLTATDIPALRESRERALDVARRLGECDSLQVNDASGMIAGHGGPDHLWHKPPTADDVLAWYRNEVKRHAECPPGGGFSESYSNAKGVVLGFDKGLEVLAITSGVNLLGHPCALFVYRSTAIQSYIESAKLAYAAAEFCEEAIMLIERDGSAYISWSG